MDNVEERAWENYRQAIDKSLRDAEHQVVRRTLVSDDRATPANSILLSQLESLVTAKATRGKKPSEIVSNDEFTIVFHPDKIDGDLQRRTFVGDVLIIRERRSPAIFTVRGETAEGRELWLTIQREHGQYVLKQTRYAGGKMAADDDNYLSLITHPRGHRQRHGTD